MSKEFMKKLRSGGFVRSVTHHPSTEESPWHNGTLRVACDVDGECRLTVSNILCRLAYVANISERAEIYITIDTITGWYYPVRSEARSSEVEASSPFGIRFYELMAPNTVLTEELCNTKHLLSKGERCVVLSRHEGDLVVASAHDYSTAKDRPRNFSPNAIFLIELCWKTGFDPLGEWIAPVRSSLPELGQAGASSQEAAPDYSRSSEPRAPDGASSFDWLAETLSEDERVRSLAPSSQGRGRGRAARSYVDRLLGCRPLPENYSELWQMEKLELFEEDLFLEQHSDPESSDDGLLVNLFEGDLSKKQVTPPASESSSPGVQSSVPIVGCVEPDIPGRVSDADPTVDSLSIHHHDLEVDDEDRVESDEDQVENEDETSEACWYYDEGVVKDTDTCQ